MNLLSKFIVIRNVIAINFISTHLITSSLANTAVEVVNAFQLLFVGQSGVRRLNTSDEITPLARQMSGSMCI